MKKVLFLFLLIFVSLSLFANDKILLINSYGEDFQWTSDEVDGILEGLSSKKDNYDFYIEYMNWKKEFGDDKYTFLKEFYLKKYSTINPKIILTTDNIAYVMAKELRTELFKDENIPIIFCGINGIKDSFSYEENKSTGVAEVMSIEDNINLILSLHKTVNKIYIINDRSETGVATKNEIKKMKQIQDNNIKIVYLDMISQSDFILKLKSIDKNSVILQGISTMYADGNSSTYENTLNLILENSSVPVYSFWTFLMNKGIVGGKLLDGKENGILAGEIAVRVLNGEQPEKIGVIEKDINKYVFDDNILSKYKIDKSEPFFQDSIIINQKTSIIKENKLTIIFSIVIIVMILIIILLHIALIRIHRRNGL